MTSMLKPWTHILPLWLHTGQDAHRFRIFSQMQVLESYAYSTPRSLYTVHSEGIKCTVLYSTIIIPIKGHLNSSCSVAFMSRTAQLSSIFLNLQSLVSKGIRWHVYLVSVSRYAQKMWTQWLQICRPIIHLLKYLIVNGHSFKILILVTSSTTTAWYFMDSHQVFLKVFWCPEATLAHPTRDITFLITVDSSNVFLPVARVTEDARTVRTLTWVMIRKRQSI